MSWARLMQTGVASCGWPAKWCPVPLGGGAHLEMFSCYINCKNTRFPERHLLGVLGVLFLTLFSSPFFMKTQFVYLPWSSCVLSGVA